MRHFAAALLPALLASTLAAPAHAHDTPSAPPGSPADAADDERISPSDPFTGPSTFARNPNAFELIMGFGMPTGFLGLGFESNALVDWLAWQVGVGVGGGGAHYGTGLRPQIVLGSVAIGMGVGISTGEAHKLGVPMFHNPRIEEAWWAEIDLQLMFRAENGWSMRLALGGSHLLNPEDCVTEEGQACADVGESVPSRLPHMGMAFGKAF